ncbi:MAG: hypothetical protein FWE33_07695 [Defluviitaleaceae bacterium]|nr:hypothetical protein [Defluviitaleaceae bacterium]
MKTTSHKKSIITITTTIILLIITACGGNFEENIETPPEPNSSLYTEEASKVQTPDFDITLPNEPSKTNAPQEPNTTLPDPIISENDWVWRVQPNLAYDRIYICCTFFHLPPFEPEARQINPITGELTDEPHWGHGGSGFGWVYDPALGLFGNPVRDFWGYGEHIGLHPLDDIENSMRQMYIDLGWDNMQNWSLNDAWWMQFPHFVQKVDATYIETTIHDFGESYELTSEAFSGKFAFINNLEFQTDFIFDEYAIWTTNHLFGVSIDGAWRAINQYGEFLFDAEFEHFLPICDETAFVKINGYYGILDVKHTLQRLS